MILMNSNATIMMETVLLEMGPKLDLTHDNKLYEQFYDWKQQVELIFTSVLKNSRDSIRTSSVKYWL